MHKYATETKAKFGTFVLEIKDGLKAKRTFRITFQITFGQKRERQPDRRFILRPPHRMPDDKGNNPAYPKCATLNILSTLPACTRYKQTLVLTKLRSTEQDKSFSIIYLLAKNNWNRLCQFTGFLFTDRVNFVKFGFVKNAVYQGLKITPQNWPNLDDAWH